MPILDIFNQEISHHDDFPSNLDIVNIEFGAGRSVYGKKEYPKCYVTDLNYPELLHFSQTEDYSDENSHFLDDLCHFYDYNFERTFENIILCNPFGYGFKGLGDAKKFFDRAGQLLNLNGEIHIIGSSTNDWCNRTAFEDYFYNEIEVYKSNYNFVLQEYTQLTRQDNINTTYRFYQTELKKITVPNEKLVIKKLDNE